MNCACQFGQQGVRKAVECACAVSEYSTVKLNGLKDSLAAQGASKTTGKFLFSYCFAEFGVGLFSCLVLDACVLQMLEPYSQSTW